MARILKSAGSDGLDEDSFPSFLEPIRQVSHEDPFETYDTFSSFIDILPTGHKTAAVAALAAGSDALGRRVAVGFLLHREELVALAAVRGLAGSDARGNLDPESRRRIRMIRDWLAPARRDGLDAAIPIAGAGAPRGAVKLLKMMASVCDGSGAANLYATAKDGSRYLMASLMTKQTGVGEALQFDDLPKDALRSFDRNGKPRGADVRGFAGDVFEVGSACAWPQPRQRLAPSLCARAVPGDARPRDAGSRLCDARRNHRTRCWPKLPAAAALRRSLTGEPRHWTTRSQRDGSKLAKTSRPSSTRRTRPRKPLRRCSNPDLPRRRAFWASQCALSALAVKERASRRELWKTLPSPGASPQ